MRALPVFLLFLASIAFGQNPSSDADYTPPGAGPLDKTQPQGVTVDQIIQRFAEKESQFRKAWDQYAFRQDAKVQTFDGDTVDGQWQEVSDITFTDQGKRIESVVFAPQSTLQKISMDREDMEDIRHRYPFVLSTDELNTYVFDIAPKKIEKDQRYVQGRVWVDQQDLQVVLTHLKPVFQMTKALEGHAFPSFTTYREQIDGVYWFPTYAKADEMLHFPGSKRSPPLDVRIRIIVKYTDYKRFGAKSRVIFEGQEVKGPNEQNQQQPQQNPPAQPPPKQNPPK